MGKSENTEQTHRSMTFPFYCMFGGFRFVAAANSRSLPQ